MITKTGTSWANIANLRKCTLAELEQPEHFRVTVGMATCGISAGADLTFEALRQEIERNDLSDISLEITGCIGLCSFEPIVEIYEKGKEKVSYVKVDPVKAITIVRQHLLHGEPVEEFTLRGFLRQQREQKQRDAEAHSYLSHKLEPVTTTELDSRSRELVIEEESPESELAGLPEHFTDLPFYKKQKRQVLRNCGYINPERIDEAIALGAYAALERALTGMSAKAVIECITDSGLRGRGGAGFPTGIKWSFAAREKAEEKYFICNADEGDPGAFMDRSVLEGDPHAVLEAIIIGGYAIGASKGFIYVRAEYPTAVKRLNIAIEQAHELGLLGDHIMASDFSFDIELRLGAGAFVCGEETALIASIEGGRGMPRNKPPFPAAHGLYGQPTIINNVETLANVPGIILNGSQWFRRIGTERSPGTKVFALGGKVEHTGLLEVPMGITLREVIFDIGGGCPDNKKFKAVQTGGPSGGCITEENLDLQVDFDTLKAAGSMMGSGGLIVMDEDNCMVDIARFYTEFTVDESCGQCVPCREGTKRMLEILERITGGHAQMEDLDLLEELGEHLQLSSLCALGQTAANPVLSTLRQFRDEYETHIRDKQCPSHVCKNLLGYIITDKCKGCTKCARICPVHAISGKPREIHEIDLDICTRCGLCIENCAFNAIERR